MHQEEKNLKRMTVSKGAGVTGALEIALHGSAIVYTLGCYYNAMSRLSQRAVIFKVHVSASVQSMPHVGA